MDVRGMPDVYAKLEKRVMDGEIVDEPIRQEENIEWIATRESLPAYLQGLRKLHAFEPRQGELVLSYLHDLGDLVRDPASGRFRFFDVETGQVIGDPDWRAGVIATVPVPEEPILVEDLMGLAAKRLAINYHGYKIESYPDPASDDKDLSWQSKHIPLRQIRPLNFVAQAMVGIPEEEWHPTIRHAIKAMATVSMTHKYHFRGTWPRTEISIGGAWVGSELLVVGDAIRLFGEAHETKKDHPTAMVVQAITLRTTLLDRESKQRRCGIHFTGETYSHQPTPFTNKPVNRDELTANLPRGMYDYLWYRRHPPDIRSLLDLIRSWAAALNLTLHGSGYGSRSPPLRLATTR